MWEPNSGDPGLANGGRGAKDEVWGGVSPPHWGGVWGDFGSQIGEFWCKLGAFLYSSPKAGLNAVPTVIITLGTPFPGVSAGNDPWVKLPVIIASIFHILSH